MSFNHFITSIKTNSDTAFNFLSFTHPFKKNSNQPPSILKELVTPTNFQKILFSFLPFFIITNANYTQKLETVGLEPTSQKILLYASTNIFNFFQLNVLWKGIDTLLNYYRTGYLKQSEYHIRLSLLPYILMNRPDN